MLCEAATAGGAPEPARYPYQSRFSSGMRLKANEEDDLSRIAAYSAVANHLRSLRLPAGSRRLSSVGIVPGSDRTGAGNHDLVLADRRWRSKYDG